jgi:hypothetical protein
MLLPLASLVLADGVGAGSLQRSVVSSRQYATSGTELEFEDGLRAQTLRMIGALPVALAFLVTVWGASTLADQTTSTTAGLMLSAMPLVLFACAAGLILAQRILHLHDRHRRRLWVDNARY